MTSTADPPISLKDQFLSFSGKLVECRAEKTNPKGFDAIRNILSSTLTSLGFTIERIDVGSAEYNDITVPTESSTTTTSETGSSESPNPPQTILVCKRPPDNQESSKYIGIFGHYDVETADPKKWKTDPWKITLAPDSHRIFGRGLGDNLGPIAQRIVLIRQLIQEKTNLPGICWLFHGEEEIGSPFAHKVYPKLKTKLPTIALWLEETGYFTKNGDLRLLLKHSNPDADELIDELSNLAKSYKTKTVVEHRYLNKAFGLDRCPCLTHLIDGNVPYVSLGPNDSFTNIHDINESLLMNHFSLSCLLFKLVLNHYN